MVCYSAEYLRLMLPDETMKDVNLGWSADADLTVGPFGDWMAKVSATSCRPPSPVGNS